MSEVFALALVSMHRDMGQVDRIAQNLANATTPGYKREVAAGTPFTAALDAAARAGAPAGAAAPESVEALRVAIDGRAGTLRMTGEPLDLAIEGAGYFEIATAAGPAYTRQGAFRLDARGRLVTAQGQPVMGVDGEIQLATRTPVIDATGRITEPDAMAAGEARPAGPVARLKVVGFPSGADLRHSGSGFLESDRAPEPLTEADVQLRQGALENANVDPAREMVSLLETMRHFESMQKVVQGYDDLMATAIRKLGDLG